MMIWPTPIVTDRAVLDRAPTVRPGQDPRVPRVAAPDAASAVHGRQDEAGQEKGQGDGRPSGDRRKGQRPPDRSLFDSVVDEVAQAAALDQGHAERLRHNLRQFIATSDANALPPVPSTAELVARLAPDHAHLSEAERAENARLAAALHQCLSLHTDGAQKIAVYLHALLAQGRGGHQLEITV